MCNRWRLTLLGYVFLLSPGLEGCGGSSDNQAGPFTAQTLENGSVANSGGPRGPVGPGVGVPANFLPPEVSPTSTPSPAIFPQMELISQLGLETSRFGPGISGDGSVIAYVYDASASTGDYYLSILDRRSGARDNILLPPDSVIPDKIDISDDGRYVAFLAGDGLAVGDDPNPSDTVNDIYVLDRQTNTIERVSRTSTGGELDARTQWPAISGDGRYVAYMSQASNLFPESSNFDNDIFLYDRVTGLTQRASSGLGGVEASARSELPAISGDGRLVSFTSYANNLVAGPISTIPQGYIWDRITDTVERVALGFDGQPLNMSTGIVQLNHDGTTLAFFTLASNVSADAPSGGLFVKYRDSGQVHLISSGAGSGGFGLSGDGRFLTYIDFADNGIDGELPGVADVFVRDLSTGATRLVSTGSLGPSNGNSQAVLSRPIARNGAYIVFQSSATNLATGLTGSVEVFAGANPFLR